MKKMSLILIFVAILPAISRAQETAPNKIEDAIHDMLEQHPVRVGIFWLQPKLNVFSGYDSNALYSPELQVGDYFASISPGGDFALRLGRRGYVSVAEDLTFLYYRDLDQRRDIYNTTSGRFVTGNRKMLLEIAASHLKQKAPINSEFDIPANQTLNSGLGSFTFAIRRTTDFIADYSILQAEYQAAEGIPTTTSVPDDHRTIRASLGITEHFRNGMQFTFEGARGNTKLLKKDVNNKSTFWDIFPRFGFSSKRLFGQLKVGYRQTKEFDPASSSHNDVIVDTSLDYRVTHTVTIGGFAYRDRSVSSLFPDTLLLITEGGIRGRFPVVTRVYGDGEFSVGNNDYGNQPLSSGEIVTKDNFRNGDLGLNYELTPQLTIRGGVQYWKRDSNLSEFQKDRFTYDIGLKFELEK